ncbi:MAG TPA: haloacid dehalogenase-like hydrolase [bacterium]|nr:haloacid dehalogenase-like hydrolase [bacterium]
MSIPPIASSTSITGAAALTPLSLLQQIGVTNLAAGVSATEILRTALSPLNENSEHCESLSLSADARRDLTSFVEGNHPEPSEALLQALGTKAAELKTIVLSATPELVASSDSVSATGDSVSTTGRIDRRALDYTELSDSARLQHDAAVRESVDRLLEGIHERSRVSMVATPKAISLKDVLDRPEQYRDRPLEIALFDVDGTTHKGELFFEGQYSIEWLLRDVLRYGPKATAGFGWWRLLKAIPGIIRLRIQEKAHGPDRALFARTFEPILKGLDAKRAQESLTRFYTRYGRRGVSEFMKTEFQRHRQKNRLIIGVSASLEYLVKMHARDLGVPEENMLGTVIEVDKNERATGNFRWLHGEEKVAALEESVFKPLRDRGIQFKIVTGYSDSPSDRPMLDLVKQDGGVAYATNPPKEAFKTETLADGGIAVDEEEGWFGNGVRRLTFATSETGKFVHEEETPPRRPAWVGDVGRYAVRVFSDTAGVFAAAPVSEAAHQAMTHGGHANVSWDLMASAPSMAVGAFFASAVTTFLVPPDGPVSGWRRSLLRGMIPVAAAMAAGGHSIGFLPTLAAAFIASAGAELVTVGGRVTGLRRWRGGDERRNPAGKTFGFWGLRSLQFTAYRALAFLFQRSLGA